jgi:PASTA domain-containing protein
LGKIRFWGDGANPAKRLERLRKEYERALAASEARRAAYHQAVLRLLEGGGPELRELAEELGLLDEPAQLDRRVEPPLIANTRRWRRRNGARAAGALAGVLVLAAMTLGALRVAQLPPFVPLVRVPRVIGLQESAAIRRLEDAGLSVRVLRYRRTIPGVLPHSVIGVSHRAGTPAAGERVARGSTITLYVVVGRKPAKKPKAHS